MGREWYQWGVKSSKNRVRGGDRSSSGAKPQPQQLPPPPPQQVVAAAAAASGCMTVVSQLFDFHHLQFCLHHPNPSDSSPDNPSSTKGVEAPRNSLETDVVKSSTASLASVSGDDNIPMGIQINTARRDSSLLRPHSPIPKTGNDNYFSFPEPENCNTPVNSSRRDTKLLRVRAPKPKTEEEQGSSGFTSESSVSPAGPRTPTLVARLMGLDLLPEGYPSSSSCTPRSSTTTPHQSRKESKKHSPRISGNGSVYDFAGSLSEPPSASIGGRRSDADGYGYGYNSRRLSLQINKENRGAREDVVVELSRHSCSEINTKRRDVGWKGMDDDDNMISRSPSYYAKQIMKQVKETVMKRRFGSDITNKTGEGQSREQRKESVSAKAKKPQNDVVRDAPSPNEAAVVPKKEPPRRPLPALPPIHEAKDGPATTEPVAIAQPERERIANPSAKRPPRMNKKEEQFVRAGVATARPSQGSDKKCKTRPLSSDLVLHGNVVPSLAPLKKSDPSIGAHRKAVQEQVSIETPKNKAGPSKANTAPNSHQPTPPARSEAALAVATRAEFNYINQILKWAGINRDTPVSFTRWFSASNPLDPALFHRIEAEKGLDEVGPPCNRRLMFELVDELLAHIVRPQRVGRARAGPSGWARVHGFQVMRMVWARVKGFPRADCRILQDIDELVEMDLSGPGKGFVAGEEEEDDIVAEIEREIVEALVVDTAVAVGFRWR